MTGITELALLPILPIDRDVSVLGVQAVNHHEKISYLEFLSRDINNTKAYF
ncbi:hypothetical protein N9O85_01175 [Porticoccaceae bacterium]|nr:hypothetical protein [Porticoccaceae bacterium]